MKAHKGFSYLEVVVSLGIIVSVIQVFGLGMHYTIRSYQRMKETEEATLYGKEVLQTLLRAIQQGNNIEPSILKDYVKGREEAVQSYGYHCMLVPDISGGSSLTWEAFEKGIHITSEEVFDLEIFKNLYEENQLTLRRTSNKEAEPLYYEGLVIQSTPLRPIKVAQGEVMEKERACISLDIELGGDRARIELTTKVLGLNEQRPIFILWEDVEYLEDRILEIEWVNHTPCQIVLGVVGDVNALARIHFRVQEGSTKIMIKQLEEKPSKESRYIVMEAVTKQEDEAHRVLKTYMVIQ